MEQRKREGRYMKGEKKCKGRRGKKRGTKERKEQDRIEMKKRKGIKTTVTKTKKGRGRREGK